MSQIIKLGIIGNETTLPEESRIFVNSGNILQSLEGESAAGEIIIDFVANKKTFTLSYIVVSESFKKIIEALYLDQIDNASFLNFIYTDQSGSEVETIVKMQEPVFGSVMPLETYYHNGVNIDLLEV